MTSFSRLKAISSAVKRLPDSDLERASRRPPAAPLRVVPRPDRGPRIGVIHNVQARHNITRRAPIVVPGCEHVMPRSHAELHDVLAGFAASGIDALIIDGGDGTIRDVTSVARHYFQDRFPRMAIVPSGKTNALAFDLGIPRHWTAEDAVDAIHRGKVEQRAPLEIWRKDARQAEMRGFIFGAGNFVRATALAQKTHRFGAFNGLAVGLSITAAIAQTLVGGANNSWRRGEDMWIGQADGNAIDGPQYLLLASTLQRMPLGITPFGPARAGLKVLRIESAPRRMLAVLPALLRGAARGWLAKAGYHREDPDRIDLSLKGQFVLDGEAFAGGCLSLRRGAAISFVVP